MLELGDGTEESIRSVSDVVVDGSELVEALDSARDRIKEIHIVGDDRLTVTVDGETMDGEEFAAYLESEDHDVHRIDVLNERDLAA